ncbi:hypothetical protein AeMF1_004270 [Aphanomyces euteiches]|nr:hypothetical protein AeMF1_004270 [Aphanomyces euteiches]KAH9187369.1 hypothetical protein AeNC1_010652 [Aphanomyces euteiches]
MTNGGSIQIPSNVFVLGNCPHDWLFPKMAAVVHHGGAGTTAAGLLAGKPTFIVPFFGDQPFWGWAVENAKVGVHPCPLANLKVDVLRQAFTQLLSPEVIANARALQAKMQQEDGIENAVQSFYRHLPNMQCALTPEHLATKWLKQDKTQVCDGCALVLRSRSNQPIEDYRPVQYGIFSPTTTLDGVSKGAGVFFHEIGGAVKDTFVEPTKGYMKDGMKGAGIGAVKGIGSMVYRPLNGVAQFVNRVAIGAQNEKAAEQGKEKHRLFEMNKLTNWVTGGDTKTTAPMVNVSLSEEDRAAVQAAFLAARAKRPATAVQENVTPSPPSNSIDVAHKDKGEDEEEDASPSKYIQQTSHGTFTMDCVDPELRLKRETAFARTRKNRKAIVNDTWEDRSVPFSMSIALLVVGLPSDVESFVAVAKALEFDGHRVRLAAARRFEAFITSQGIEYVPLEGNPTTGQERLATASAAAGGAPWQGLFGKRRQKVREEARHAMEQ